MAKRITWDKINKDVTKRAAIVSETPTNKLKNAIIDITRNAIVSTKYNNPVENSFIYKFIRTQLKKLSASPPKTRYVRLINLIS